MDSTTDSVRIHYRRPPDREDVFVQRLLEQAPDVLVTFMEKTALAAPMVVNGATVLESGSPVIWFTFPERWHDIGLFHTAAGQFTGTYANILTPVRFLDRQTWATTDLFLDVWMDEQGRATLLDEDELEVAIQHDHIGTELADRARNEADRILRMVDSREWPPRQVADWTLERALDIAAGSD